MPVKPFLNLPAGTRPRAVILLSGGGSNAERLLEALATAGAAAAYEVAALVTDNPAGSRAGELAQRFNVPLVANDIREFYRRGGESRVTLATTLGRELRDRWTAELRRQLAPLRPDFGILAGFVPLTNLTGDFPCLNVHPGDLTVLKDGRRWLVGLHTVPIERAILDGHRELRSSAILALPYTGEGNDMDNGPLLGLSGPVPVDLQGHSLAELRAAAAARPPQRPAGGFRDLLATVAQHNQERLKAGGDWVVFPRTVEMFAKGRYGQDAAGGLLFRLGDSWLPIETVVFSPAETEVRFR
ncbi:MAG: hypothetical protein WC789_12915 [Lentisphaeria bacterium]|jgi:phosphoribosylglycinamide formyltransferase-1